MKSAAPAVLALSLGIASAQEPPRFQADPPKACDACEAWNAPQQPFRVFGNTWYVGTGGLSAVLVTSPQGHVLLDGGLSQSAPRIDASIRALGFRTEDVRLIVNSHAHYDHAGGIAALQRRSGAKVAASASGARALETGEPTPDDPQYALGREANGYPPVTGVRVVADGETLRVGDVAITAHYTPGHTPGATTWTWRSCEGQHCLDIVYADSLNAVSAPGFRFTGDATHRSLVGLREQHRRGRGAALRRAAGRAPRLLAHARGARPSRRVARGGAGEGSRGLPRLRRGRTTETEGESRGGDEPGSHGEALACMWTRTGTERERA